ncbi:MAG TPA: lysophospholipid acyltransferase family protein [Thermoanaerobaculia bacterium]|nr:lysophospholipid acyltransferase family protein [Thermoanaerobaculia bacterium]
MSTLEDPFRASRLATAVATVACNLFLVLGSLVLSTLGLLVGWLPPRTVWTYTLVRLWARGVLSSGAVRVEAHYDPAIDPAASYVFLANHQSLFDIPAVMVTAPGQVRLVAKRSLFKIPIFGWSMAAGGFIPVDREDRSSARETFASAVGKLRRGTSILLFPEGTRGQGDRLLPFQRGGLLLALKSGLPIVPVGIHGTRAIRATGSLAIHPGTAVVRYGPPIDAAGFGLKRKGALAAEVRRRVAELAGMEAEDAAVAGA